MPDLKRIDGGWNFVENGARVLAFAWNRDAGEYQTDRGESLGHRWDEAKSNGAALAQSRMKRTAGAQ